MRLDFEESRRWMVRAGRLFAGLALTLALFAMSGFGQAPPADSMATGTRPVERGSTSETYETLHLTHLTEPHDARDIVTVLRNMLPRAALYYSESQDSIYMRGTPEDILVAHKLLLDLDRPKQMYRLTYSILEADGSKRTGVQHFSLIVVSGSKTELKQGTKVPVAMGTTNVGSSTPAPQMQYVDVGVNIEASVVGSQDGALVHTKVEQSSIAADKSGAGTQDPVIRQTVLEDTSTLVEGKALVLGSLDVPDSTRRQEVEVVSELIC